MSHARVTTAPESARVQAGAAARAKSERGRRMILWGWVSTMVGIVCYCRAIFALGPEAEIMDAVTGSGGLGWISAVFSIGGIALWLGGNLYYLLDAMHATSAPAVAEAGEETAGQA